MVAHPMKTALGFKDIVKSGNASFKLRSSSASKEF